MSEIDVSKCPHKDNCMYICDNVQDCLYKNYKRLVHTNNATKRARDDYKNIANKLKAENEELKKYIDRAGIVGIIKLLQCLDEIEKICHENKEELNYKKDEYNFALVILQLIKQAKEGE